MKTLYIECKMGVAGDMLMAALSQLVDMDEFLDLIQPLRDHDIDICIAPEKRLGITGAKADVKVLGVSEEDMYDAADHGHTHSYEHSHTHSDNHVHTHSHTHGHSTTLDDVVNVISSLNISATATDNAIQVYKSIADTESTVHGVEVSDIHFHEVGTKDAIADVTAVCILMDMIRPQRIITSPVNVGNGTVRCAHGILPVPAPATALLLRDIPMYTDDLIETELCTPTGAALIRHFSDEFGPMPIMRVARTGHGFGGKRFDEYGIAGGVRVFLGESQ